MIVDLRQRLPGGTGLHRNRLALHSKKWACLVAARPHARATQQTSSPMNFFPMLSGLISKFCRVLLGSEFQAASCLSNGVVRQTSYLVAALRHPHILTRMSNRYRESMTPLLTLLAVVKKLIMGCPCREKHRAIVARNLNREVSNTLHSLADGEGLDIAERMPYHN